MIASNLKPYAAVLAPTAKTVKISGKEKRRYAGNCPPETLIFLLSKQERVSLNGCSVVGMAQNQHSDNIAVLYNKYMAGCSTIKGPEALHTFQTSCLQIMPFSEMLHKAFDTDAHFVCYAIPDLPMWPRLNKPILPEIRESGSDVTLSWFNFDWDNVDHKEWTHAALDEFVTRIATCTDPVIASWHTIYTTKGGARIIYRLNRPVPADEAEHHLSWMIHHFKQFGFTQIDESCKDWTRLMRCPKVIRDNVPTWQQGYFSITTPDPNRKLNLDIVGKMAPSTIARKKTFDRARHEAPPSYDKLEGVLQSTSAETGKIIQTEFVKKAKKSLKKSPYYDILFSRTKPDWPKGSRNDSIMRMLGIIVPILLRETFATVEQIYALIILPLLTLERDKDWPAHGWNALLDIYEREIDKYNRDQESAAQKVTAELSTLDKIVEGMRKWCNDPAIKDDDEAAREYARQNIMATVGNFFFLMGADGYYDAFPITANQIIARIRKTPHLNDIIKTTKIAQTGEEVDVTAVSLQNTYSTAVSDIQMKPVGGRGGYITDMNGAKPALVLSTFARNDSLIPEYNQQVDEWLQCLGGCEYDKLCQWIGNALAFEEGLICALSLEGASNAGKKLLTVGLSECLKEPAIAGPMDIYGASSAFLKTPFLVVNEAWPDPKQGMSPADTFKSLTGGDGIRVNEKYKPAITILCPVRVILTANDDGIIKTLTRGKDMTYDNRVAIGERLFHIKAGQAAADYLNAVGGMSYTSRIGARWIRPDSGAEDSDYIVAKHFLWLYHHRKPIDTTQRFLVMGNSAPGRGKGDMTIFEKLLADGNSTPLVAQAVIEMADKRDNMVWREYIRVSDRMDRLWVTRFGVRRYVREVFENRTPEPELFSGMLNLLAGTDKDVYGGMTWYEISVEALAMIASEHGYKAETIRKMAAIKETVRV